MNMLGHVVIAAVVAAGTVAAPVTRADSRAQENGFISVKASEIKWADAPSVGPGAKIAVLEGDLKAAAPFTMRLMLPPSSKVGVHTHPAVERVTVLSGTFYFAIGDQYEPAQAAAYQVGDGFMVPVGMPMFGYTKNEASIIQIHGVDPWGLHYLDPAGGRKK